MISPEVMKKIKDFNRKYEQAEKDGYYCFNGWVLERKPMPWEYSDKLAICKIEDYKG